MPKSLNLSIPVPCHEDWSAMQPEEKGRHCAACQKTVVDFTAMSDAEVVAYMTRASSNVCGRFAPDQLGRKLEEPAPIKRSRWPGWQLVLTGALLTADGSKVPAHHLKGMIDVERVEEQPTVGMTVPKIVEDTLVETKIQTVECYEAIKGDVMIMPDTLADTSLAILGKIARPMTDSIAADTDPKPAFMGTPPAGLDSDRANDRFVTGEPSVIDTAKVSALDGARPSTLDRISQVAVDTLKQLVTDTLTKLNILPPPKTLALYPNPVPRGSSFRIAWPEEAGTYQAALYTTGGRLIQQRVITVNGPGQTEDWALPGTAAGVYVLQVRGQRDRYSQKVVVQ